MAKLNAAQAEQIYPVSRMTIGRWIKRGYLAADIHGQFDEEALKVALASKSSRGRKLRRQAGPAPGGNSINRRYTSADVIEEGHRVRNALTKAKAINEQLRVRIALRKMIPYKIAQQAFLQLGGVLEVQFRMFSERVGENLYAAVQSGEALPAFRLRLQQEIDASMRSVLAMVQQSVESMRQEEGAP